MAIIVIEAIMKLKTVIVVVRYLKMVMMWMEIVIVIVVIMKRQIMIVADSLNSIQTTISNLMHRLVRMTAVNFKRVWLVYSLTLLYNRLL